MKLTKRFVSLLVAASMVLIQVPMVSNAAEDTNLALHKPVQASREYSTMTASEAVDGIVESTDRTARWSTEGAAEQWLQVDLNQTGATINSFRIVAENAAAQKIKQFKIEGSNDGENFTLIHQSEAVEAGFDLDYSFDLEESVSYRYIKLTIQALIENAYPSVSLREFEVLGTEGETPKADPTTNVALGKTVVASSKEADSVRAELAVDGDTTSRSSRWGSGMGNGPHWIYVDLGAETDVRTVKVFWENRKATSYSIDVSNDAQTWTTVKSFNDRPVFTDERIVLDETVQARYVRLYVNSFTATDPDTGGSWNTVSIYELEVYGGEIKATLQELVNGVSVNPVNKGDDKLTFELPELEEGIEITYNGTDYEQVVDSDLTIYEPLVDTEVKVSFKITNTETGEYKFREIPVTIPGTYTVDSADNAAPVVLPELTEWKGHTGEFTVADGAKIIIADNSLKAMADEFAADYLEVTGKEISVKTGTAADAKAGDFFFTLTADKSKGLKEEGYLMEIADSISVTAETSTGAYWATRTILQAFTTSDDLSIAKGITRDYPLYEVRGFILDVGRKTFTMDFLQQIVKQMAWFKLNDFHVHLNDNLIPLENYSNRGEDPMTAYSGFRLESDIVKGGTVKLGDDATVFTYSADLTSKDVFYTKDEFRSFIDTANVQGVNIVPEIDTPAHSLALTKVLPELRTGTWGRQNDHLDLKNQYDECYDFVTNIFDEYMTGNDPVFSEDTIVHVGCDEYTAAPNKFREFNNDMLDYVQESGRTPRIWGSLTQIKGDGSVYVDGTDAQMNIWNTGYANAKEMYDLGFSLINCVDGAYYIVPNAGYYYDYLNAGTMYNGAPNSMGGVTIPAGDELMIGAAFAVWNDMCDELDNGVSEYDVYKRFNDNLGLYGAKLWGKGDLTLDQAKQVQNELGDAPNTNFHYEADCDDYSISGHVNSAFVEVDELVALELKGSASYASTAFETVGFDHVLTMKVKRTSDSTDEQVLLESPYGEIKAVQTETGKVGISRENFDFSFNYTLPVDEWVELEFRNSYEEISLYVNGELVDTIGDNEKVNNRPVLATCMFPLATIGSETNAFVGYVASLELDGEAFEFTLPVEAADYSAVEEALAKVPADFSIYTDESVAALEQAIDAVEYDLLADEQEVVDGFAKAIEDAIAGLTEKETEKPSDDEQKPSDDEQKPSDDEQKPSDDEQKPSNDEQKPSDDEQKPSDDEQKPSNDEQKPSDDEQKPSDDKESPSTGDAVRFAPYLFLSLAAIAAIVVTMKKKEN